MTTFRDGLLAGKVAFVAGGTSGINLGIAKRLAENGRNGTGAPEATEDAQE